MNYGDEARAALIENVEWIIGTDTPESIARRVGYRSPRALARQLHRWGRPDLAQGLDKVGDPYHPASLWHERRTAA